MTHRRVEPELLDELPATDPRAARSREDLRRINRWMRNIDIMRRALHSSLAAKGLSRVVELGAGDGTFLLRVAQSLPQNGTTTAVLVDQQDLMSETTRHGFAQLGWRVETITADVFDWLQEPRFEESDVIVANLFLHHFIEPKLAGLLVQAAQHTRRFVAVEPRRWGWSLLGCRLLWLIGCNSVTRHDAVASVRAGFAGKELSRLWPAHGEWQLEERAANLCSHLFVATRRSA